MFGWEALLLVRKVEQDVLEIDMSPALVTQNWQQQQQQQQQHA